jgi:hypothetical protein
MGLVLAFLANVFLTHYLLEAEPVYSNFVWALWIDLHLPLILFQGAASFAL